MDEERLVKLEIITAQSQSDIKDLKNNVGILTNKFNQSELENVKMFTEIKGTIKNLDEKFDAVNVLINKFSAKFDDFDKVTKGNYNTIKITIATAFASGLIGYIIKAIFS